MNYETILDFTIYCKYSIWEDYCRQPISFTLNFLDREKSLSFYLWSYCCGIWYNINRKGEIPMQSVERYVNRLKERFTIEMQKQDRSGVYSYTQRNMAYNSNKIEGSTLTKEQTNSIFTTGTMTIDGTFRTKDVEETSGHFAMFNEMLKKVDEPLSESIIKEFHYKLKSGVWEDMANGYAVGEYKQRYNQVADIETTLPHEVPIKMQELLEWYHSQEVTLKTIAEFHIRYERIHPFQDGNGRTGRIIMFKECLKYNILPFVILDSDKIEYYHALDDVMKLEQFLKKSQKQYVLETLKFLFTFDEMKELYQNVDDTILKEVLETTL